MAKSELEALVGDQSLQSAKTDQKIQTWLRNADDEVLKLRLVDRRAGLSKQNGIAAILSQDELKRRGHVSSLKSNVGLPLFVAIIGGLLVAALISLF